MDAKSKRQQAIESLVELGGFTLTEAKRMVRQKALDSIERRGYSPGEAESQVRAAERLLGLDDD